MDDLKETVVSHSDTSRPKTQTKETPNLENSIFSVMRLRKPKVLHFPAKNTTGSTITALTYY